MRRYFKEVLVLFFFILFIFFWVYFVVTTHPKGAIISWDEGFHGGSAFYLSQSIRENFNFEKYEYILKDFKNGVIWYLPIWLVVAGISGVIFEPSVEVYRFASTIFSLLTLFLIFYFVRSQSNIRSSFIALTTLAFSPIFIIYSHLMMRESSLIFCITLTLLAYFYYLTKDKANKIDIFLIILAFGLGSQAKIMGILIIFGVITTFGIFIFFFQKKTLIFSRFFSLWTVYFLCVSAITFNMYRQFTITHYNADLVGFHLGQLRDLSGEQTINIFAFPKTLTKSLTYYLEDFSNMKLLTGIWFGSMLFYLLIKRSLLSIYLLVWTVLTYIFFSSVRPQAYQYILPIFSPIAISVGLFWGEILKFKKSRLNYLMLFLILINIIWLGRLGLDRVQSNVWRSLITNQEEAVKFVVNEATEGDRILSSGDGTRFLISLYGSDKKLQTINGAAENCPDALKDSIDWAISDFGPQNPIRLEAVKSKGWKKVASLPNQIEPINVYQNLNIHNPLILKKSNLVDYRCTRFLPLGENSINMRLKWRIKEDASSDTIEKPLKVALKQNLIKSWNEFQIQPEEINSKLNQDISYTINFKPTQPNQPTYFNFYLPKNLELEVSEISIENLSNY